METKLTNKQTILEQVEIPRPELIIRPQTSDDEYDRVSFYLKKLPWYRQNGYKLILPDHPVFQQLAQPDADLSPLAYAEMRELFAKEVYDVDSYADRLRAVEADKPIIEQAFPRFQLFHRLWGFKVFPRYEIALTHFGTLGSYDEKLGKIIVSTQATWPPKKTAIHEGVHLGIEGDIVQQFGLSHWEKERTVDHICRARFGDLLPGYEFQVRGDERVDPYVTEETLGNLPESIKSYVEKYPRER